MRVLNPIWTGVEARFLRERLQIDGTNLLATTKTVRQRLAENGLVSITVTHSGAQRIEVPVFGGSLTVASGAAHFAHSTGAALLPIFCVRNGRRFEVRVEPPLSVPTALGRDEMLQSVAGQFGAVMERFLREYPTAWTGWRGGQYHRTTSAGLRAAV
jgi:lauroyl/myristoyl acyltransferase